MMTMFELKNPIKILPLRNGDLARGGDNVLVGSSVRYTGDMKKLTVIEFARMGGRARAAKLTPEQLSAIGKKGGRPKKPRGLGESPRTAGSPLKSQSARLRHKPASRLK